MARSVKFMLCGQEGLSFIPRTYEKLRHCVIQGWGSRDSKILGSKKSWIAPELVLWPPHVCVYTHVHARAHTHTHMM